MAHTQELVVTTKLPHFRLMDHDTKILHVVTDQWTGQDGKTRTDILAVCDDNKVYKWHMGSGTWVLHIINR